MGYFFGELDGGFVGIVDLWLLWLVVVDVGLGFGLFGVVGVFDVGVFVEVLWDWGVLEEDFGEVFFVFGVEYFVVVGV